MLSTRFLGQEWPPGEQVQIGGPSPPSLRDVTMV